MVRNKKYVIINLYINQHFLKQKNKYKTNKTLYIYVYLTLAHTHTHTAIGRRRTYAFITND